MNSNEILQALEYTLGSTQQQINMAEQVLKQVIY